MPWRFSNCQGIFWRREMPEIFRKTLDEDIFYTV